jgi:hypothetical protein
MVRLLEERSQVQERRFRLGWVRIAFDWSSFVPQNSSGSKWGCDHKSKHIIDLKVSTKQGTAFELR